MAANTPDLILEGHEAVADYALAWSPTAPIIASGGKDKKILLWNIENFLKQKGIYDENSSSGGCSSGENTTSKQRSRHRNSPGDESDSDDAAYENLEEEYKERQNHNSSDSNNEEGNKVSGSKLKARRNKKAKEPSRQIKEIGDYLKPTKVIQKTM